MVEAAYSSSAMEIETAVRSRLPIIVFVINNNGIYFGLDAATYSKSSPLPSTALTPDTRYDLIAEVSPRTESGKLNTGLRRSGLFCYSPRPTPGSCNPCIGGGTTCGR